MTPGVVDVVPNILAGLMPFAVTLAVFLLGLAIFRDI